MRLRALAVAAAATLTTGVLLSPAGFAGPTNAAPGGFMSDNVTWLGNIPVDGAGIGGRPVDLDADGDVDRFYVTALQGLSIYDLTIDPAVPVLMGHLPLPHWENEDVSVSADGTRVLVSTDALFGSAWGALAIIDASIPQAPVLQNVLQRASHTVTCVDDACDWVYSSEGEIYDLRDPLAPVVHSGAEGWIRQLGVGLTQGAHDLNVDDSGLVISDTLPRLVIDVTGDFVPGATPRHPKLVSTSVPGSEDSKGQTAYQHNNQRTDAAEWTSRSGSALAGGAVAGVDFDLAPGELMLANGETNFTHLRLPIHFPPRVGEDGVNTVPCDGETNGPFATWDMADFNRGRQMRPIEVFRPVTSNLEDLPAGENRPWLDGNPQLNALGCSGHWFDHLPADADGQVLVAAGWYDHGTRILSVDAATGDVDEVGFFQPVDGSVFAAHWVSDDVVYTVDVVRGIDIFRFDRDGTRPSIDDLLESWTAPTSPAAAQLSATDRFYCILGIGDAVGS